MNPSQIDEAILSAVAGRWTKVAMVIARVTKAMEVRLAGENLEESSN